MNKRHNHPADIPDRFDNMKILHEASREFKTFCREQHLKIYAAAAKALQNYIRDYVPEK